MVKLEVLFGEFVSINKSMLQVRVVGGRFGLLFILIFLC
jgi:hypothetical protein